MKLFLIPLLMLAAVEAKAQDICPVSRTLHAVDGSYYGCCPSDKVSNPPSWYGNFSGDPSKVSFEICIPSSVEKIDRVITYTPLTVIESPSSPTLDDAMKACANEHQLLSCNQTNGQGEIFMEGFGDGYKAAFAADCARVQQLHDNNQAKRDHAVIDGYLKRAGK